MFFGIFPGFVEFGCGADGAVGFIDKMQRDLGMECLQLVGKTPGFLCGLAFSAIEMTGQTDDNCLDLTLLDDRADACQRVLLVTVDGFDRMRHDAHGVGRGDADAGVAVIDAEGGMWKMVAQEAQSK